MFFIIVVLIGNFFFLNLFQGVLFGAFCDSYKQEKEQGVYDTKESQVWWDFLGQIDEIKPDYIYYTLPNNKFQRGVYMVVSSRYFDSFIFFIIFFNLVILGISSVDSSIYYQGVLNTFNIFFTSIFFLEFVLKIIAIGVRGYIFSSWNLLDLFIIISSVNIGLTYGSNNKSVYFKAFQALRIFRLLSLTK